MGPDANTAAAAAAAATVVATADNRFQVLNHDQVERLHTMLSSDLELHSRCARQPTVSINLNRLVKLVREGLTDAGVPVRDTRLNGGAASYVIGE